MSILDRILKRGSVMPKNATFRLTQEGREKLQDFTGDAKGRILVALESQGTSDIEEISRASGISRGQVERVVPILIKNGYVQYVSAAAAEE